MARTRTFAHVLKSEGYVSDVRVAAPEEGAAETQQRKLVVVLRAKDGDRVEICDSSGTAFDAVLAITGSRVQALLQDARESPPPRALELVLAQGLPKGQKMDFAIEKATQIAAVPLLFADEKLHGFEEIGVRLRQDRLNRPPPQSVASGAFS